MLPPVLILAPERSVTSQKTFLSQKGHIMFPLKLSLQEAAKAHKFLSRRGYISLTIGSQMAVMSALRAGSPVSPERYLILIYVM
jgi:hypothetical protein